MFLYLTTRGGYIAHTLWLWAVSVNSPQENPDKNVAGLWFGQTSSAFNHQWKVHISGQHSCLSGVIELSHPSRVSIGSGNGLSPIWFQAISINNDDLFVMEPSTTNFSEIFIHKYHDLYWGECIPNCRFAKFAILSGLNFVKSLRGRVMHTCISKLNIIGSDNGFSLGWCQAIIWTNAGILLIQTLRKNFSETLIEIHISSFKHMNLKMSSAKWKSLHFDLYFIEISVQ